jgi:hypothetical protein
MRRTGSVLSAMKGDEEGVTRRIDLIALVARKDLPEKTAVIIESVAVVVPELANQQGRSLDVREEKGDSPGRPRGHSSSLGQRW